MFEVLKTMGNLKFSVIIINNTNNNKLLRYVPN